MRLSKLEDFGMNKSISPRDRKTEYIRQCKLLPRDQQAKFWMSVLEHDPEIAPIVIFKRSKR